MKNLKDALEYINSATEKDDVSKAHNERVIKSFIKFIKDNASEGVQIKNFATFKTVESKARKGHNFQTGESFDIPATSKIKAKISKKF